VEHLLAERGDGMAVHEKARAESLAADARQALAGDTPLDRLKAMTGELQQVYQGLLAAGAVPPQGGERADDAPGSPGGSDDDVIDAEFTTHE
jgi:molecular chaperone DnaK